jgi:hypothetical protein
MLEGVGDVTGVMGQRVLVVADQLLAAVILARSAVAVPGVAAPLSCGLEGID